MARRIPRVPKRQGIFSEILKLAYLAAMLTHACAYGAIWHGDYPIMGTMRVYEHRKLGLILGRRNGASVHPVLGSLKGYVKAEGEFANCE
jgi:hypothetical protein